MTTSSPGFQRVTPSPTFHTIPEASEPPMWCPYCGWSPYGKTETGLPSAAHTLLKFTPAAMTRTMTSKAPGSGTSISSTWKASSGSPSRSWRMTHAAIVAGSSPGWASTFATCDRSTAISGTAPSPARVYVPVQGTANPIGVGEGEGALDEALGELAPLLWRRGPQRPALDVENALVALGELLAPARGQVDVAAPPVPRVLAPLDQAG